MYVLVILYYLYTQIYYFCIHSDVGTPPPNFLQDSLDEWMSTDKGHSQCTLTVGQRVAGAPYNMGIVNQFHPITGCLR